MRLQRQNGFTLIELLVGIAIAVFVTAAAVAFASHETRLMGLSQERVNAAQQGRGALDLIVQDITRAGMGVRFNGRFFGGFSRDNAGSVVDANGRFRGAVALSGEWNLPALQDDAPRVSDHIALVLADGDYATICNYGGNTVTYCNPNPDTALFDVNEEVVLWTADLKGMLPRAVVSDQNGTDTPACTSVMGCEGGGRILTVSSGAEGNPHPTYPWLAGDGAMTVISTVNGGEVAGGLKTRVWYVDDAQGLRRGRANDSCTTEASCSGTIAQNVEFLAARVWRWDGGAWVAGLYPAGAARPRPYRVDVELVLNTGKDTDRATATVQVMGVLPGARIQIPEDPAADSVERQVFRTSVEVRNSRYDETGS